MPAVTVSMPMTIAIVMFTVAAAMLLFTRAPVDQIVKTKTCQAGLTAVIGILGLAWLGDTFIDANQEVIIGGLSRMAEAYPALFSVGLFVTSMLLYSQAATTQTLMPLGVTLGIAPAALAGMFPGGQRLLLHPDLRHADRRGEFRSQRHDAHRQVRAESLVHAAGPGLDGGCRDDGPGHRQSLL